MLKIPNKILIRRKIKMGTLILSSTKCPQRERQTDQGLCINWQSPPASLLLRLIHQKEETNDGYHQKVLECRPTEPESPYMLVHHGIKDTKRQARVGRTAYAGTGCQCLSWGAGHDASGLECIVRPQSCLGATWAIPGGAGWPAMVLQFQLGAPACKTWVTSWPMIGFGLALTLLGPLPSERQKEEAAIWTSVL